jgi:AcrR family transcriptional regulator
MSKAERTKANIIAEAAPIFNTRGYSGTSISDIMAATGLKKGGIYNHFVSKDELAVAAFDYANRLIRLQYLKVLRENAHDPVAKLRGLIIINNRIVSDPVIEGGCPIMNTAIESDDTHPELKKRARRAMRHWKQAIEAVLVEGMDEGLFYEVNPEAVAEMIIATVEGGVMMGKLHDDPRYLCRMIDHLLAYVERNVII